MKKCPFCAEEIQDEAAKCKHCGEWLSAGPSPVAVPPDAPPTVVPPAAVVPPAGPAPAVPPAPSPSGAGTPSPMAPAKGWTTSPAILVATGGAVLLAVVLIVVLVTRRSAPEAARMLPAAVPSPVVASTIPTEASVPTPTAAPHLSDARVNGLYDGPKYDFAFKASCKTGPCGGVAQSGAQFRIKYGGHKVYHGTEKIRSTCSEGGVHVQAPLHVSLVFRPIDAAMIGGEFVATKVDIDLQVDRKGFKKSVHVSPTTIRTLTCKPYHLAAHFVGTLTA